MRVICTNISMATVPITTRFLFFILPTFSLRPLSCLQKRKESVDAATPAAMPLKRKESVDPVTPAAPAFKKARIPRLSAAATTPAQNAPTAKPLLVTKVPTMTPAALQSTTKNPSYSFGAPAPNEKITDTLDYSLHPGVPLHSLIHPEAAKLFESVKVFSSLPLYLCI